MGAYGRLAAACVARRRSVLAGWLLLVVVAALGTTRLRLDFSSTSFYGGEGDEITALREFVRQFGPDDAALVVVASAPAGDSILARDRWADLAAIGEALVADEAVHDVVSVVTVTASGSGLGPASLSDVRLAAVVPALVSDDRRHAAVIANLREGTDELGSTVERVERLGELVGAATANSDLELALAGVPAIRAGFFAATVADQRRFVPLTVTVIALILWLTFRRAYAVWVPLVAAALPLVILLGLMGWMGHPIGLINQAYFTLIPVIAVADAIHFVTGFREARDKTPAGAVIRVADEVGVACVLTSSTTAIGFASLAWSDAPAIRGFGLFAAVGLLAALAVALTLVPVMLSFFASGDARRGPTRMARIVRWTTELAIGRPRAVLLTAASITMAGLALAPSVVIDNRLTDLLDRSHASSAASELVDTKLGGTLSLEVALPAEPGFWDTRAGRERLTELHRFASELPSVRSVIDPRIAGDRYIDSTQTTARISIRMADIGGRRFGRVQDTLVTALRTRGIGGTVTGSAAVAYEGVNRITDDLRASLLGCFGLVIALIGVFLRNARAALWAIPANLIPLAVAYGAVGLLGFTLDPIATLVLAVGFAIAVDDTVHLTVRFERARLAGNSGLAAIRKATRDSGRPIVVTSLAIAAGLAIDLGSSFPPLRMLGGLGAGIIMLALVTDLIVLPAIWAWPQRPAGPGSRAESARRTAARD